MIILNWQQFLFIIVRSFQPNYHWVQTWHHIVSTLFVFHNIPLPLRSFFEWMKENWFSPRSTFKWFCKKCWKGWNKDSYDDSPFLRGFTKLHIFLFFWRFTQTWNESWRFKKFPFEKIRILWGFTHFLLNREDSFSKLDRLITCLKETKGNEIVFLVEILYFNSKETRKIPLLKKQKKQEQKPIFPE